MSAPALGGPAAAPPQDAEGVGRKVALGSAFMVAARLAVRGIAVISSLILVRLLLPEDFGLISLAGAMIAIAEVMTMTGVGMAVIRHPDADRALYDTAWTMNLLRCLLLGGLFAGTAHWQAELLGDARIGPILMVVGLTTALSGLSSAGLYRLQRELRFNLVFRLELVTKLSAFIITITLAVLQRNYWCLVLGNLAALSMTLPYGYWIAPHRPRLCLARWRELFGFSKWMIASNTCSAIESQSASLSVGRILGLPTLGIWQISWQLAAVPVTELAVPIRGPVYAGYARVRHDAALLRRHFLAGFGLLVAVVVPLSVGIALVAPEVERIALGPAFAGADVVIAFCAFYVLIDALGHFTFNLFIVLGAQPRMVAVHALVVLLRVPAVVAGAYLAGVEGVGLALVVTALLGAIAWHREMARIIGHRLAEVAAVAWRSLAAAAVMAALVLALRGLLPASDDTLAGALLTLLVLAGCGAATHVGAQALLWVLAGRPDGAERHILGQAVQLLRRLRARQAALP